MTSPTFKYCRRISPASETLIAFASAG
jgi:hypothetical protein